MGRGSKNPGGRAGATRNPRPSHRRGIPSSHRQVSWLANHPRPVPFPGSPPVGCRRASSSLTVAGAAADSHRFPYCQLFLGTYERSVTASNLAQRCAGLSRGPGPAPGAGPSAPRRAFPNQHSIPARRERQSESRTKFKGGFLFGASGNTAVVRMGVQWRCRRVKQNRSRNIPDWN
jgi:hypothetical protein